MARTCTKGERPGCAFQSGSERPAASGCSRAASTHSSTSEGTRRAKDSDCCCQCSTAWWRSTPLRLNSNENATMLCTDASSLIVRCVADAPLSCGCWVVRCLGQRGIESEEAS